MVKQKLTKYGLMVAGSVCLVLGVIGIFIPVLPTTPFLLLASFCYLRSSKALYSWLIHHKLFGKYIYFYLTYKAIQKHMKIGALLFLWLTLILSMLLVPHIHIRIFLLVVGVSVSIHLLKLKILPSEAVSIWEAQQREKIQAKKSFHKGGSTVNKNQTYENLMEAFAGESQANRKYLAYSKKAEADGKLNAAKLFKAASDAEALHALKHLEVAGKIGSTANNLKDAVTGENYEYQSMYPDFLKTATAEGSKAAIIAFTFAMKAEEVHARLYKEALENLDQTEEVFYYLCPVCGNIELEIPAACSICGTPGANFIKY